MKRPLDAVVREVSGMLLGPEHRYKRPYQETLQELQLLDPSAWFDGLLIPEHMLSLLLYEAQGLEERAMQLMWDKFDAEGPLDEGRERDLLKFWERAALYRRYAAEIMSHGIQPRHLGWDEKGKLVPVISSAEVP